MMLHPALFVLAALAVAGSAKAAEPTPDEVLDAALAVISNRAIRNGCVELEERVEIDATESHRVEAADDRLDRIRCAGGLSSREIF